MYKKQLAFFLFKYFPYGGLQRDFIKIAKEALLRGYKIDVYTGSWDGDKIDKKNININILNKKGFTNHARYKYFEKDFHNKIKNKKYDAIVGFNKISGLDIYYAADTCFAAKAAKKPFWYKITPRCKTLIEMEKSVFDKNLHTKILLLSEKERSFFIKYYNTEKNRFFLLPPGIDKKFIPPDNFEDIKKDIRKEFFIKENQKMILMIGSGFKTKGVDRAIKALAFLPDKILKDAVLVIVGDDKKKGFERLSKKLNVFDNVIFTGGRDDVEKFLFAADVFLHPAYRENTGTVILEAMAAQLPVLVTKVCGYSKYVTKANSGIVLPEPFEQKVLNDKLLFMINSDKKNWQKECRTYIKKNDIFSLHKKAMDIIEKI
jgi:UDP-glucose:(heptosyl)LPS alpha-1,3-glucosyltransferase